MTEVEWAACRDPRRILDYHLMKKDPRRLRLLACACVRIALPLDPWMADIIGVVEQYADGEASRANFLAARKAVRDADPKLHPRVSLLGRYNGLTDDAMDGLTGAIEAARRSSKKEGKVAECGLIRCIFPFQPVAFDPAWLTSTVVTLSTGMYKSRDFAAMPILADALQDAGCDNESILSHCRGPGPHVRGCHCVDSCLGKN